MLCRVYTHALGYEVQSSEQKIHLHQYRQAELLQVKIRLHWQFLMGGSVWAKLLDDVSQHI